jgi:solute carrier family 30 (zinc transporter), member 5/7
MPSILTESGGINLETCGLYWRVGVDMFRLEGWQDSVVVDMIKVTWSNENSQKILLFFGINLIFFFVEFIYGYFSNSLGLISDAFHMLFDCTALFIGLIAAYIAQLPRTKNEFTFGYSQVETISGLFNGIFLIFISFNIFSESIERIFEPIHIHDEGLITVSVLGLIVNMIGLFFFHDFHHHGGEKCSHVQQNHKHEILNQDEEKLDEDSHSHSGSDHSQHQHHHDHHHHKHAHENNANLYGIYLHILADALGSIGVIISSVLVKYYNL